MTLPAYTVTRRPVKNLRITVRAPGGHVNVTAPRHVPDAVIREFVAGRAAWIGRHQERIARMPSPLEAGPQAEDLRRQLKSDLPPLISQWSAAIGVDEPSFTVRRMRSRWGTCNTQTRRITLNLELARRDRELLEYVVVHELAHLIERGHNARFYSVMDAALPDWRDRRRVLNGQLERRA